MLPDLSALDNPWPEQAGVQPSPHNGRLVQTHSTRQAVHCDSDTKVTEESEAEKPWGAVSTVLLRFWGISLC